MYQWVATRILDGVVFADLNGVDTNMVAATIGRYESTTATLPLPLAGPGWERTVEAGATVWWLLGDNPDDPAHGIPLWGGYITQAVYSEQNMVTVTLATLENYLDQRYTGARTYTSEDQNLIVSDLIANCVAAGPQGGLPITVQVVGGAGAQQTIAYADQDDKTVYSALTDLTGLPGGPEWAIGGVWAHNPERILPVLYVGNRLGVPATPGLSPACTFEMPGCVAAFSTTVSYAQGYGANSVMAYSSGQGTTRPQSPMQNQADPDRPTFEYRWSPTTSTLNTTQLQQWAAQALTVLSTGSPALALTAAADQNGTPRLGADWGLGDDIGYQITAPAFPNGVSGVGRAIGFQLTLGNTRTVTPILATPQL